MRLNEYGKIEIRTQLELMLNSVDYDIKIHIDKDLLDDLIFFKGKNNDGELVKIPFWTGKFLRKIDLSEISFDNVFFHKDLNDIHNELFDVLTYEDVIRFRRCVKKIKVYVPEYRDDLIDLSYTNAKIDFSKCYNRCLKKCNLAGVDLSMSNGDILLEIIDSDLSSTGIKIDFDNKDLNLKNNNFSNNNFADTYVDVSSFGGFKINNCCFFNTGLNVSIPNLEVLTKDEMESISKQIKVGNLDGCLVNGKRLKTLNEKKENAKLRKEEYNQMKKDILDSVSTSIHEQVSEYTKKLSI